MGVNIIILKPKHCKEEMMNPSFEWSFRQRYYASQDVQEFHNFVLNLLNQSPVYLVYVYMLTCAEDELSSAGGSSGRDTPGIGGYPGGVGSSSNATGFPALWFLTAS